MILEEKETKNLITLFHRIMQNNEKNLFYVPVLTTCYLYLGNCRGIWWCNAGEVYISKLLFLNLIFSTLYKSYYITSLLDLTIKLTDVF